MKILVTGASGFIGQELITRLHKLGHEIYACSRNEFKNSYPNSVLYTYYDINRYHTFDLSADIDVVVHMAAFTTMSPNENSDDDVEFNAAKDLYEKSKLVNAKFIFISSLSAQQNVESYYGRTKFKIESYLKDKDATIIRPGLVYGSKSSGLYERLLSLCNSMPVVPIFKPVPHIQVANIKDVCGAIIDTINDQSNTNYMNVITKTLSFDDFLYLASSLKLKTTPHFIYIPRFISRSLKYIVDKFSIEAFGIRKYLSLSDGYSVFDNDYKNISKGCFCSGFTCSGDYKRRLLIVEARALIKHILREEPSLELIKRYVRSIDVLFKSEPMYLSTYLTNRPTLISLYDNLIYKNTELTERLNIAMSIVESSPSGFNKFIYKDDNSFYSFFYNVVASIAKEALSIVVALPLNLAGYKNILKRDKYDV